MVSRSKSLVRAAKRLRGELTSQREAYAAEPLVEARSRTITEALESNAAWARGAHVAWPDEDAWRPKSMFDLYYRLQRIVERSEWDRFALSLRAPLPITFRYVAGEVAESDFRARGEAMLERIASRGTGTRRLGLVDGWRTRPPPSSRALAGIRAHWHGYRERPRAHARAFEC